MANQSNEYQITPPGQVTHGSNPYRITVREVSKVRFNLEVGGCFHCACHEPGPLVDLHPTGNSKQLELL